MSTSETRHMRDLLDPKHPFDRGVEPGSVWYMRRSTRFLIRTKALQAHSYLIYPRGDAIVPISPKVFRDPHFEDGDIVLSKDSNVGESALVDAVAQKNHMFSGGLVRLHPTCDRYYLFAFLKHPIFKAQLLAMVPRGATITHAGSLWLDCLIPFPQQPDQERAIQYVSILMQAIVEKEKAIRARNALIDARIEEEVQSGQGGSLEFHYSLPTLAEIRELTRLDVGMYSDEFKRKIFRIRNYKHGSASYEEMGFTITRGQNLQVSCIGKSIYSDVYKPNFYRLVAPTDISEYRTVEEFRYLGNKKELSLLRQGDVVFGAEGFRKGRVVILADEMQKTVTNIHGVIFHHKDGDPAKGIFLGCFLGYLRSDGIVDAVGAGGSGGSLAIGYFGHVPFPRFQRDRQLEIARLYHNPAPPPKDRPTLDTFLAWHRKWNEDLGVWELDREMKTLQRTLLDIQEKIIAGESVRIPI